MSISNDQAQTGREDPFGAIAQRTADMFDVVFHPVIGIAVEEKNRRVEAGTWPPDARRGSQRRGCRRTRTSEAGIARSPGGAHTHPTEERIDHQRIDWERGDLGRGRGAVWYRIEYLEAEQNGVFPHLEHFDGQRVLDRQDVGHGIARRDAKRRDNPPGGHEEGTSLRIADRDERRIDVQTIDERVALLGGGKEDVRAVVVFEDDASQAPTVDLDFEVEFDRIQHDVAFRLALEIFGPTGQHFEGAAEGDEVVDLGLPFGKALSDDRSGCVLVGKVHVLEFGDPLPQQPKLSFDGTLRATAIRKRRQLLSRGT